MKGRWLYLALCVILIIILPQWLFFYVLVLIWQYKFRKLNQIALVILLGIGVFVHQHKEVQLPSSKIGVVEEIRSNYLIAKFDDVKGIVYTDELVPKGTMIKVSGKFQQLENTADLYAFNFDRWCLARNITSSINAESFEIVQSSSSLQHFFFERINSFDQPIREWCFKVFYGVKEADTFYLISASALHLAFIMQMIVKWTKNKYSGFVFLIVYGCFINFSFAICRLLIFTAVRLTLSDASKKDRLGLSILITILLFPYAVYELSFILPVAFSLLSLFSCRKLSKLLSSWLVLMPIQLLNFYEFNLFSPLLFSFYRFWYSINLLLTMFCVLLPMKWIVDFLILMDSLIQNIQLPLLSIWGKPSLLIVILYLCCLIAYISEASLKYTKWLLCGMLLLSFSPYLDPCYEVTFINVGQGDSILITLPFHGGAMMIDVAGSLYTNIPERKILPVLKAKGYKSIEQLVITHSDYDHSGGLEELLELVNINKVITDKRETIEFKNLQFVSFLPDVDFGNENDNSIVLLTRIASLDYLFMGDASQVVENQMLSHYPNLKCDILKAGHHGSNTSSSALFIQTLSPHSAILSVGRKNRYGHPHKEVVERMNDYHINVFRTDLQGDIEIKSFLNFNFIITGSHEFGIISKW